MRISVRHLRLVAGVVLTAAALGCVFAHDDQGTETIGFVTPLSLQETHDRAVTFFQLQGYTLVDSSLQLVRAEKVTPLASGGGDQRDVLTVRLSSDPDGTRVTTHAITYLVENGQSREAPQLSTQLSADWDRLNRFLMGPRPT